MAESRGFLTKKETKMDEQSWQVALETARTQQGESLARMAQEVPVLLIFLRHAG